MLGIISCRGEIGITSKVESEANIWGKSLNLEGKLVLRWSDEIRRGNEGESNIEVIFYLKKKWKKAFWFF